MDSVTSKKLTQSQLIALSMKFGYDARSIKTIINVETPGFGFSEKTGRPLIQFEPSWFKRKYDDWRQHQGVWIFNGINDQTKEWIAFNNAFMIDADAAMQSTSIGMMQVMGFHYKTLDFKTVGEMWDFAKVNEANQVELGMRFIAANPALDKALKEKDWHHVAYYYNGAGYRELAERTKSTPYNVRLQLAYIKAA